MKENKIDLKKEILAIVVTGILLIAIIVTISMIILNLGKSKDLYMVDVIDIVDIKEAKKITVNDVSDVTVANIYNIENATVTEANEEIKLGVLSGKLLFVRGEEMNANIYQAIYGSSVRIDDDIPVLVQIDQYIKTFTEEALYELDIPIDTKPVSEKLYGESKYSFPIPLEESIYKEKRLYSKTYNVDGKTYNLNFYMNDDDLICELVKIID